MKSLNPSRIVRKPDFAYAKTKAQISFAVTAKLISAFVLATRIVQFLFFLKSKFQSSRLFLKLYRPVCVRPGRKPRRPVFSRRGSNALPLKVYTPGPSCSKLMTSLVNVSFKFQTLILQIHCYFLLKKCANPLHCKGFSHFFNKK